MHTDLSLLVICVVDVQHATYGDACSFTVCLQINHGLYTLQYVGFVESLIDVL